MGKTLFLTFVVMTVLSCNVPIMNIYNDPLFRIESRVIRGELTCQPWGALWLLTDTDVEDMDKKICAYFKSKYAKGDAKSKDILLRFDRYRAQYCGFVRENKRMIYCHLFLDPDDAFADWKKMGEFAGLLVSGGEGTQYLYLIYDTTTRTFIDFWSKGT